MVRLDWQTIGTARRVLTMKHDATDMSVHLEDDAFSQRLANS